MDNETIIKEIKAIIEDIADIPQDEIKEGSSMIDDLNLSSLEIMSIIADVETKFSVHIPEEEMLSISSLEELADIVRNKMQN